MTDEEEYNYKIHTIRGRFLDLKQECEGIINLSFFLGSIVVMIGIIVDIYKNEMWRK